MIESRCGAGDGEVMSRACPRAGGSGGASGALPDDLAQLPSEDKARRAHRGTGVRMQRSAAGDDQQT